MAKLPNQSGKSEEATKNFMLAITLLGPTRYQEEYMKDPDLRRFYDAAYDELVRRLTLKPERCIVCDRVVEPLSVYCEKCVDISDKKKEKYHPARAKRWADQHEMFHKILREIINGKMVVRG